MDLIIKVFKILFIEEIFVFIPLILLFFYFFYSVYYRKKFILNFCLFLFPALFLFYSYSYLPNFFSSIGQDSILELKADFGETLFYLKTFFLFLFDPEIFKRNRFWLLLLSSLLSALTILIITIYICKIRNYNLWKLNKVFNYLLIVALFLATFKIIDLVVVNYNLGKDLKNIETLNKKNINKYKIFRKNDNPLKIITYIGESTSALNLSLYGYPFDTSPNLLEKEKTKHFIKFTNTFATHTHSSPSLSDSLSLCMSKKEEDCIGFENLKNNLSVVDILNKNKLPTYLFSTQGTLGGHNFASKLSLNTNNKFFSYQFENKKIERKFLGNRYAPQIKDKDFFTEYFCKEENYFQENNASIAFLHSYAGHGYFNGYLEYIPEREKFTYPRYINKKNFLGRDLRNFELIREYDTAIKYIDETLDEVIDCSLNASTKHKKPLIFIYFSDHGESPATSRGHDSTRLTYEMLHVPLVMIFNEEAYNIYKEKFLFLESISKNDLTLKIISDLIIYLFDIDIKDNDNKKTIYPHNSFKSLKKNFIMVTKDLNDNVKKLNTFLNYTKELGRSEFGDKKFSKNDTSINLWQLGNYYKQNSLSDYEQIKKLVCQHRANSFINQYKASLSNSCFETDVFFGEKVISTHDIKIDTGLNLEDFLKSSYKRKNTLWLDSKNLYSISACNNAYKWLNKNHKKFLSILVETPTSSIKNINDVEWLSCIDKINNISNIQVAYYLPTKKISECSKINYKLKNCRETKSSIIKFLAKSKINLITFDYSGYNFVKNQKEFEKFKWNIWHLNSVKDVTEIMQRENIGIVLLRNDKFFNNLN